MLNKIIFTKIINNVSDDYGPCKTSELLPEWYKKTPSYVNSENKEVSYIHGNANSTIKKCIPVFDVLTSGYIITTYCDVWVKKNDIGEIFYVPTKGNQPIEFHPIIQAPYHPNMNNHPYPKWINPWAIKTPKGYSSLFIAPVHGGNKYFQIIEGIVDTDNYSNPVNFPFVLKDKNFEGLIPAGTPIVQIIPFKREKWKMEYGSDNSLKEVIDIDNKLNSQFFDRYKKMFWNKKEFL